MKRIENVFQLKEFLQDYEELKKISKKLQKYNEILSIQGLTKKQWKRKEQLEKRAEEIAEKWNMKVSIEQDPRVVPIYLVNDETLYREQGIPIFLK